MMTTKTIGELYMPAMAITDQDEADAYFEELVRYGMAHGQTREEAEQTQRHNLGYFAGYYDDETRARVERLYLCAHPVFGTIAKNGAPSPGDALAAGAALATETRKNSDRREP
jgi:hypothetical protein